MRFDQTSIAIRERSALEVFDLAANVIVRHFRPIMVFLVLNALPFLVFDYYLINWMTDTSYSWSLNAAYFVAMTLLIISQAQVGTCLLTIYMGRMMFMQDHSIGAVLRQFFKRSIYFMFSQGLLRLVVFAPLVFCFMPPKDAEEIYLMVYLALPAIVCLGFIIRIMRPYTPEVIFLEQTPLRKLNDAPKLSERSSSLHLLGAGFVAFHCLLVIVIAPLLLFSVHSIFIVIDSTFSIRANADYSLQPFYLLASGWLVAGFFAIVRFLMYIDLRIRQEGWAVQLKLMTENNLLNQSDA